MASETIKAQHTAGTNVYIVVNNETGATFFDFSDDTFKALASCTTPYVAMTERTDAAGASKSLYSAVLDLADLNNTGTPLRASVTAYKRLGGSPAPLTDLIISQPKALDVQFGELGIGVLTCQCHGAFTTTEGVAIRFLAWLERNGQKITLSAGSCTITVREHGEVTDLFTVTTSTIVDGGFEITQLTPGYDSDRVYRVTVEIEENAATHTTIFADVVF